MVPSDPIQTPLPPRVLSLGIRGLNHGFRFRVWSSRRERERERERERAREINAD